MFTVSAALLLLAFVLATLVYNSQKSERSKAAAGSNSAFLLRFHSPSLRPSDAKVQPELIWTHLDGVGLNLEQIRKDMNDPEITRLIEIDRADANALKVTRTPEYFVNGRQMPSFGYEQLRTLVQEELARAYR